MKAYLFICLALSCLVISCSSYSEDKTSKISFCNPINLDYRFQLEEPSRREAADPSIIRYNDEYFMFLSKSGGYYHSENLVDWELISSTNLPIEEYAPTAISVNDTIYFMTKNQKIYKSSDPLSGKWEVANDSLAVRAFDPSLFLDDNEKLYLYHGLSARMPIRGVELDRITLQPVGEQVDLLSSNKEIYGWERSGDYNFESSRRPWVEGAFVTKHNDIYYLQYSVPGTQFKSYADGMYISNSPLGPFKLAEHNPFSYKPEGFIAGAGHGSTFQDEYGNYWYAGTMTVVVRHRLERRVGLFPAFFDEDDCFYAYTGFGDFPHNMPTKKMKTYEDYQPAYMLLSYNKPVEVSSSLLDCPKEYSVNEDIKTHWSATSGDKGEWMTIDLEEKKSVNAIQVNFSEVDTKILGRTDSIYYQYLVEYSNDNANWETLVDKIQNTQDRPHDYTELSSAVEARYIRITNYRVPDGKFAISGFRVFGFGNGDAPKRAESLVAERVSSDACVVNLTWKKRTDATGYNIRYGTSPDKLYLNYQVLDSDSVTIYSLNQLQDYYFAIDAFNENGITKGREVIKSLTSEE